MKADSNSFIYLLSNYENIKSKDGILYCILLLYFITIVFVRSIFYISTFLCTHCGMKCAALSIVVNLASGLTSEHITHDETLHYSAQASANVSALVLDFVDVVSKTNLD